jgi:multidrug efflux pump subunit AcrA (membrane-fusion protein)
MRASTWVVEKNVEQVNETLAMRDTNVNRVRSVAGVDYAVPMFHGLLKARAADGSDKPVQLVGLHGAILVGRPPTMVRGDLERLRLPNTVAAAGIVEARRENVKLAAPKGGLVTRVFMKVGVGVEAGAPLFQLDDREAQARVASISAQVDSTRAALAAQEVELADWTDQLERFKRPEREKVATGDELKRRWFVVEAARARLESTRAQIAAAEHQLRQARIELAVLMVHAPRDGELLQVNVREGEFAPAAALNEALMLLGDVETLQIRAEVDEQNAVLVEPNRPARGSLKQHADLAMDFRFVRVEPFVIPKRRLTGDSLERVDTRVLQIIYEFDHPAFRVHVGQRVDVFIERPAAAGITNSVAHIR